ncbi:hypothetical protein GOB81_11820 [Acetobacter sp. LMG 1627]|uniref:Uncharacterized protein n=1 Tax=Acetobacter conturbans TaxID=1737472 RepID=A0ABX0K3S1_9PROT|nr:hypothetical protein [Acetobacter conturbans]
MRLQRMSQCGHPSD